VLAGSPPPPTTEPLLSQGSDSLFLRVHGDSYQLDALETVVAILIPVLGAGFTREGQGLEILGPTLFGEQNAVPLFRGFSVGVGSDYFAKLVHSSPDTD